MTKWLRTIGTGLAIALLCCAAWAAGAGVLRLNAYFASDFTDAAYQRAAFAKVVAAWKYTGPLPAIGKRAVVISTVRRDGTIAGLSFNMNSGSDAFDNAAMAAVKSAGPLAALPAAYKPAAVEVHWHFEVGRP